MITARSHRRRAARGLAVLLVFALCWFVPGPAPADEPSLWEKIKAVFEKKEPPLPPVEDVYNEAMAYFTGRETRYGALVRKVHGEESWAYENFWGVKRTNYTKAREAFQKVIDNYPFSKYAALSEIRVADCHFQLDEYEQAAALYRYFIKMHPRHEEVPHAIYHEGLCHYERMLKPGRDQTHTEDAERLFKELLSFYPESEYSTDAKEKLEEVRTRLARHELRVAEFYFKKKEYWSAAARYRGVHARYGGLGFDAEAMFQEAACYDEMGKEDRARLIYDLVSGRYGDEEYGRRAKERLEEISVGPPVEEAPDVD